MSRQTPRLLYKTAAIACTFPPAAPIIAPRLGELRLGADVPALRAPLDNWLVPDDEVALRIVGAPIERLAALLGPADGDIAAILRGPDWNRFAFPCGGLTYKTLSTVWPVFVFGLQAEARRAWDPLAHPTKSDFPRNHA